MPLEAYGDVKDRRKLREKLGCKDFKWFLENVYPDIQVPEDRPGMFGMLKNRGMENYCFDYNPPDENKVVGHRIILYPCHGMGQNQFFEYSSDHEQAVPEDQKFVLREDGSFFNAQTKQCVEAVEKSDNGSPARPSDPAPAPPTKCGSSRSGRKPSGVRLNCAMERTGGPVPPPSKPLPFKTDVETAAPRPTRITVCYCPRSHCVLSTGPLQLCSFGLRPVRALLEFFSLRPVSDFFRLQGFL
ncbi:hypothetical protein ANANG_G00179800 [Anguilla anguilla]|uniref:Ricin B lectin domain-containing protein n=1 Tax=Anguilla anguilla TaxID=7936 RepID=A0A9D3M529_ANGAN|nr:hypothetical protein ANANG_G00179800 [Anguilla anguilla]